MAVGALARRVLAGMTSRESELSRRGLVRQKGQILVINKLRFKTIIKEIFGKATATKAKLERIWSRWDEYLQTQQKNVKVPARLNELIEAKAQLKTNTNEKAYIIGSYNTIKRQKRGNGKLGTIVSEELKLNKKENDETFKLLGGQGSKAGAQLGHEEGGRGLASSSVNALKAESMIARSSVEDKGVLESAISTYKNTMTLDIKHSQVITKDGKLKKSYVPLLSWQESISNQEMKEAEEDAVRELNIALKDIATMDGSTPLLSALTQVTLEGLSPTKKRKNVKVVGKKASVINESTKGASTKKTTKKKKTPIVRDSGIERASVSAILKKKKSARAVSPFSYMAMINKKLPETVRKNMGGSGLQNRTGRFANSVKVQDVNVTKQGHPSFGYTYAKNPYQVFEVGEGSAPWANSRRDPRKLIDKSIREVAAELAIGRFYTRRL